MRKITSFLLLILLVAGVKAAPIEPLAWKVSFSKQEVKVGDVVDMVFEANIPAGNHAYAINFCEKCTLGCPNEAEFTYKKHASYQLVGKPQAIGFKEVFDDIFECTVKEFFGKAKFIQQVKILAPNPVISGTLDYQTCSESMCLPYEYDFKTTLKVSGTALPATPEPAVTGPSDPASAPKDTSSPTVDTAKSAAAAIQGGNANPCEKANMSAPIKAYEETNSDAEGESLLGFMILGFIYGLGALLTPCVFPMIPMTVTFFTKKGSKGRFQAIMYGLFIILIYTVAGTLVAALMGPDFANWLSTHWVPNILFFAIFLVFGFSFLGAFEIVLPSSMVNKVDKQSDRGGLLGVFFMAFTMVLVSFSCTGPLASNVLIESFGGNVLKPIAGMFSFSLAFAIPFTLFAIFPQWLSSLPKSGGWLNSVKVVLGFIEIGLALKFLSVPDTVYHWGILDRDIYLSAWIILAILIGLYLIGKLKFSHDSDLKFITVPRIMLALFSFSFAVWLIPGLFGAPLAGLSGYLPPKNTLSLDLSGDKQAESKAKYADLLHFPHGINGYFDYCEAIEASKRTGKPIFIDFTGHGCVNCRKMEEKVWAKPEVLKKLKEDYIMLALYADERLELPETEWYISPYDNKVKKTLGKQNLDLQVRKFNQIAQPYYVIMDAGERLLAPPRDYGEDVKQFLDFLETGKKNYIKLNQ